MTTTIVRPADRSAQTGRLEILSRLPAKPRRAPPLLFVHGAWHGAWCWEDHFLDYFARLGYASYALNLRGHGNSLGARDVRFCRIRHFVDDVRDAVAAIGAKPILIGHSMGGFVVQKYLETATAELGLLLASVPPDGAKRMLKRVAKAQPLDLLVANIKYSLRPLFSTTKKVRQSLFTATTPENIVERCAARLQDDVILGFLDYLFLDLVDVAKISTELLVIGASGDRMIGGDDLRVTGRAYGREPVMIPDVGHDLMIDENWEQAAATIAREISSHFGFDNASIDRRSQIA